MVGAITGPRIVPIPQIAIANDLCLTGNAAKTNVCDKGGKGAPKTPWATLEITISSKELDKPQNIDEIINPKTLKIRMVRICILEVNQPAKGVKIAVATILPVTTQEI